MSPTHVQRMLKRVTGISPKAYARALRHDRFLAALGQGQSVTDALYGAGFNSSSTLYAETSAQGGMTPAAMAKGGAGETIGYATAPSPLGRLLVARTQRGASRGQPGGVRRSADRPAAPAVSARPSG